MYLSDLLVKYTLIRSLKSSDLLLLAVPKTKHRCRGDRAFAAVAPKLWNSLPLHIQSSPSVAILKSNLKTHLYSIAFNITFLLPHLYHIFYFFDPDCTLIYCIVATSGVTTLVSLWLHPLLWLHPGCLVCLFSLSLNRWCSSGVPGLAAG